MPVATAALLGWPSTNAFNASGFVARAVNSASVIAGGKKAAGSGAGGTWLNAGEAQSAARESLPSPLAQAATSMLVCEGWQRIRRKGAGMEEVRQIFLREGRTGEIR